MTSISEVIWKIGHKYMNLYDTQILQISFLYLRWARDLIKKAFVISGTEISVGKSK